MDWVMSYMDEPDSDEEMKEKAGPSPFKDELPGIYNLQSFITHLGASTSCGHYVCHVKKDGKWVYYNDRKVAFTTEPPIGKGYMYFFVKKDAF